MGANKNPNFQRCGEILIDIRTKNRKKKMYIFYCTFCNVECDQLKKFSQHIEEEHLSNVKDIPVEPEINFEAEPEKLQSLIGIEKVDNKTLESSVECKTHTVKIKSEVIDNSYDEKANIKEEVISPPEFISTISGNKRLETDCEKNDEAKDDLQEMPLKKIKLSEAKMDTNGKLMANTNKLLKNDLKDAENNTVKLKFEAEPEEIQIQSLTAVENETVNLNSHNEFPSCIVKKEFIENSNDQCANIKEEMVCSPPMCNDDKESNEDPEFISIKSEDKRLEIDSESEDEAKGTNVEQKNSHESMDATRIKENILSGKFNLTTKKGRSKIWDIFGNIVNDKGTEILNKVACTKCFSVFKYDSRSTSNLVRHKCYYTIRENNIEKVEVNNTTKKEATRLFFEWCVKNCRPIQFVQDSGLIKMSEFLISIGTKYGPNVDVEKLLPHPNTISQNIEKVYEATFLNVKNEIQEDCQYGFGLTSDIWTDSYLQQTYISLTIHYIKNDQLISRLIGLDSMNGEKYTHDAIRLKTQTLLGKYDRKLKDGVMVTDKSSNMVAEFNSFPHIYCINHLLNNVIENAIKKVEEVTELCNLCSKLLKYLQKTGDNCKLNQTLNSNCPTRWNTMYYLLESVEKNWMDIKNILQQNENELQKVEKININHIKGIVNVLRPFEQAFKTLEEEKYATLHLVYAYIIGLKDTCISEDDDIEVVKKFKEALLEHIQTILISNISMTHKIAHFLFPPANKLLQFSEEEKENIKSKCAEELRVYWQNEGKEIIESPTSSKTSVISSYFKNFVTPTSNLTSENKITGEIQRYQNMNVAFEENFDVISWWYLHRTQLPLLYKLSCKLLATPASSATSERVFSIGRQLLTEKRTNLSFDSAIFSQIMFLHMNPDKLTICDIV